MTKAFYGLEFEIDGDVIVPYAQTERLAAKAIELLTHRQTRRVLDLGCGVGNIAISILKNVPDATAVATDISQSAVELAKVNAERHGVADSLAAVLSDGFDNVKGRFDLIVCNSPYLPANRARGRNPIEAYTDGSDGLTLIRQIAAHVPTHLVGGGIVALEYTGEHVDEIFAMFEGIPLVICPEDRRRLHPRI